MSSVWKRRLRLASIPSTAFAALVFSFGWMSVSPFASWPFGLIALPCVPALIPFALTAADLSTQQGGRLFRGGRTAPGFLARRLHWRDFMTVQRALFAAALSVLVSASFFMAFDDYRGSPEVVNGTLVFTDHGRVIGPATEREADEARTRESRMISGHLMLFGVLGLLARVPSPTAPARSKRPESRARSLSGRPGGPRRRPS